MDLLHIICYLLLFYIIYSWYNKLKFINKNQLKGPLPIPLIGSYFSDLPFTDLFKLTNKYGDIFRIWVGDFYIVVISDISIIKELFIKNHEVVTNRPQFPTMKHLSNYHGLVTSSGEYWKLNREIVSTSLTKIHLKQLYQLLELNIDKDMQRFKQIEKSGESFNPHQDFIKFTTSLMFKYCFNQDLVDYDDPVIQNDIINPTKMIFEKFGAVNIFDYIGICRPLYDLKLKLFETSNKKITKFLNHILDQHISSFNENQEPRDLMDILIKNYQDRHTITSTCSDLLLGGIETTSTVMYHCIIMACIHQDIQEKVYNEIKSNINNSGKVTITDKSNLPFTNSFIKECMRVLPISGFPVPRVSNQDILINDKYFIPKDSHILINLYALYNNEKYFENPSQFNPSRFLDPNSISNQAFIPFIIGPRACVARHFAWDNVLLYISNLFLNFKITSTSKNINHSIQNFSYGLTLKFKDDLRIILQKRF